MTDTPLPSASLTKRSGGRWLDRLHLLVLAGVALAVSAGILAFHAWSNTATFNGFFANGAFQLYNPLRRLADGQLPGRDYPVFHGFGIVYLHYPLFWITGGDLRASEFARWLMSPGLFVVSSFLILFAATRSLTRSFLGTALLVTIGQWWFPNLVQHTNSLLGVRSTLPILAAACLMVPGSRFRALFPFVCGLAFLIGTEHGISALAASVLIGALQARTDPRFALTCLAAPLAAFAMVAVGSLGHPFQVLGYNLGAVSLDQGWYFGAPPSPYGWEGLVALAGKPVFNFAAASFAAGCLATAFHYRCFGFTPQVRACVFLLLYGAMSCASILGYVTTASFEACSRASFLALLVAGASFLQPSLLVVRIDRTGHWVAACLFLVALGKAYPSATAAGATDTATVLGVVPSRKWSEHLRNVTGLVGSERPWSVYASLIEAVQGSFHPHVDYIIHALGPEMRAAYVDAFLRDAPRWVRTDTQCEWLYGSWLRAENWSFYREVAMDYVPVYQDTIGTLWKKGPERLPEPAWSPLTVDGEGCFTVAGSERALSEIEVGYEAGLATPVPLLNNIPRYMLTPFGPLTDYARVAVSLPGNGYGGRWSFPVVTRAGETTTWCPYIGSAIPGSRLRIREARIRTLPVAESVRETFSCPGPRRMPHEH